MIQLKKSAGVARWAYNWALGKQIENYKNGGSFIQDGTLRKELTQLKKTSEYKWLSEVSAQIPKQAVKDLCVAYKRFFEKTSSFPKFKSRKSKQSFYNDNARLKVGSKSVLIEKVGWVKTSEQLPMNKKYKNPRISFDNKYWYISISLEYEPKNIELSNKVIGIDLGIKNLAVTSEGRVYLNINKSERVKKINKRLDRLQRRSSRKYIMNNKKNSYVKTNNISKLEDEIRLLYRRLTNIRKNYLHQVTNSIVKERPHTVVVETLNIKGMMKNRYLSKSISDQKLSEFIRQLEYKCQKYGIQFIKADMFYPSSKMCSNCGNINKDLRLSNRVYNCECGLSIDRDLNAAINLANYVKLVD